MKRLILSAFILTMLMHVDINAQEAQNVKLPGLDASPADIALLRQSRGAPPLIKVLYSRPQMKGRNVFGEGDGVLVPFGQLWRTGANETTEITFYQDVTMGGEKIEAGTYSLYTIPGKDEWTFIINSKLYTWGHFQYDEAKDVYKFKGNAKSYPNEVEAFTITFASPAEGSNKTTMYLAWENTLVEVPVEF